MDIDDSSVVEGLPLQTALAMHLKGVKEEKWARIANLRTLETLRVMRF